MKRNILTIDKNKKLALCCCSKVVQVNQRERERDKKASLIVYVALRDQI